MIDYDGPGHLDHHGRQEFQIEHPEVYLKKHGPCANLSYPNAPPFGGSIRSNDVTFMLVPVGLDLPEQVLHGLFSLGR